MAEKSEIKWIFVFGTLKPGFSQHTWNRQIHNSYYKLTCERAILSNYVLYKHEYPTIIQEEGKHVNGYAITSQKWDALLKECDVIEGYPDYYYRVEVPVTLQDQGNKVVQAWAYKMSESRYTKEQLEYLGSDYPNE